MTCKHVAGVHICRSVPTRREYSGELKSATWCWHCRKRFVVREVALVEIEPSYYPPHCGWECPRCKRVIGYTARDCK